MRLELVSGMYLYTPTCKYTYGKNCYNCCLFFLACQLFPFFLTLTGCGEYIVFCHSFISWPCKMGREKQSENSFSTSFQFEWQVETSSSEKNMLYKIVVSIFPQENGKWKGEQAEQQQEESAKLRLRLDLTEFSSIWWDFSGDSPLCSHFPFSSPLIVYQQLPPAAEATADRKCFRQRRFAFLLGCWKTKKRHQSKY